MVVVGGDEDRDAPRRLYYVAMTRAKKSLTLARLYGPHGFLDDLADHPSVICREPGKLPPDSAALRYYHACPILRDVDLGFAGRRSTRDAPRN